MGTTDKAADTWVTFVGWVANVGFLRDQLRGSGRRLHGVPLTVRPCDEPSRFGPRRPNGVCFSVYPDISASGGKLTGGVRLKVVPS